VCVCVCVCVCVVFCIICAVVRVFSQFSQCTTVYSSSSLVVVCMVVILFLVVIRTTRTQYHTLLETMIRGHMCDRRFDFLAGLPCERTR